MKIVIRVKSSIRAGMLAGGKDPADVQNPAIKTS
jgi:hypothetical protein